MDTINSQSLLPQEAYYHAFTKLGSYNWGFVVKQKNAIQVQALPPGQKNKQWIIKVAYQNGQFQLIDGMQANITVSVGDSVSWEIPSNSTGTPGYSIVGDNGKLVGDPSYDSFSNRKLGVSDAFSHLFWTPGAYEYTVSGGVGGVQSGSVPVLARPPAQSGLPPKPAPPVKAILVVLNDGQNPAPPVPEPVADKDGTPLYTGDTVIWTIADGANIVIQTL